jgi:hypothetical protein
MLRIALHAGWLVLIACCVAASKDPPRRGGAGDEVTKRIESSGVTVLVDNMRNEAWSTLGGGPNMAVLIGTDGKGIARQAWFDADAMADEIAKLPE